MVYPNEIAKENDRIVAINVQHLLRICHKQFGHAIKLIPNVKTKNFRVSQMKKPDLGSGFVLLIYNYDSRESWFFT
jgi:hypothetical protein